MLHEQKAIDAIRSGMIFIDDEGRVWKRWRYRGPNKVKCEFAEPQRIDFRSEEDGYHRFPIYDGTTRIVYVHRVAWMLANGDVLAGLEVDHKDRNRSNNRLDNLELKTRVGNLLNKRKGKPEIPTGRENALEIRRAVKAGEMTVTEAMKKYDKRRITISRIVRGLVYPDVLTTAN